MTASQVWLVSGLSIGLVGSLLVSIEAVKLDNVRKLILFLRSQVSPRLEIPRIVYDMPTESERKSGFDGRLGLNVIVRLVLGALLALVLLQLINVTFGVNLVTVVSAFIQEWPLWIGVACYLAMSLLLLILIYFLGRVLLHFLIGGCVSITMRSLESLNRHTPTGSIGMIGFLLLFASFTCQIVGTVVV